MISEISAGAVVYRIAEDGTILFLLLLPARGKPWGFPKGKIHAGETEEEAARREIAEEAGLREVAIVPSFRRAVHYSYRRGRTLIRKAVIYFLARAHTAAVRISTEHVAYRWVGMDKAIEMVMFENARRSLRRAYEHISVMRDLPTGE